MKKSNRKKFLQFVVLVLFLAALFVPQDANRLLIAGIALIGIGVTLFSYLLPLFTERLKNREHGCCGMRELISWVQSYMVCGDIREAARYTVLASASADAENRTEVEESCLDTVLAA